MSNFPSYSINLLQISGGSGSPPPDPPTPPASGVYVLMDFNDSVLHDRDNWLATQTPGTTHLVVWKTGTPGLGAFCELSLASGEGRDGTNAMRVTAVDDTYLLPSFYIGPYRADAVQPYTSPQGDGRYALPRGVRANRLSCWVKYPAGFRSTSAATTYQNFNYGTYLVDPPSNQAVESFGHFYHQLVVRHDLLNASGDNWCKIVVNYLPHHDRGVSQGRPVVNPKTSQYGNYFELMTRFYLHSEQQYEDPQIAYPFSILVDSIQMEYIEEDKPVEIQVENFRTGQMVPAKKAVETFYDLAVTNTSLSTVSGIIGIRAHANVGAKIFDGPTDITTTLITISGEQTKNYSLRVNPAASYAEGQTPELGIIWVDNSEITTTTPGVQTVSLNDSNVHYSQSTYGFVGACDSTVCSTSITLALTSGVPSTDYKPWVQGGVYWSTSVDTPLIGQLDAHDPGGDPFTYSLIFNSASGGSISIDPNTGIFTYTPSSGFTGNFQFRYKVTDGTKESIVATHWIIVS